MLIIRRLNCTVAASGIVTLSKRLFGAQVTKQVYQYKNIKIKLCKNNAAIWYNKICSIKQLTPNYVNIRVNDNNPRCQRAKNAAIRYRINQELKFQYAKKYQLNEQLYKVHLECATLWSTTWQLIQSTIGVLSQRVHRTDTY